MQITIKAQRPEEIRDEIVHWLDNAAEAERSFGNVMSGKRHKERCEYAAEVINRLARNIADMHVVLDYDRFIVACQRAADAQDARYHPRYTSKGATP